MTACQALGLWLSGRASQAITKCPGSTSTDMCNGVPFVSAPQILLLSSMGSE